jgi:hypothetical protein
LPKRDYGVRTSEFDTMLNEVHEDERMWGKPVSIRRYEGVTAAKAAANVLRQRLGRNVSVSGHEFAVRSLEKDGVVKHHLFVTFDPAKIVDGAWEDHQTAEQERLAKAEAKKAASNGR